jgi:transcriptional regulator with XRE-family HTH domain
VPFGEMLAKLRMEKGLSLRQLAAKVGMDFTVLSKIEHGDRPPPELHQIFALADALGVEGEALEELVSLATESTEKAGSRLSPAELERMRQSRSLRRFLRHRPPDERGGERK